MTTILQTIKPFYCQKIQDGEKRWEIRKTRPNISRSEFPFRVLLCRSGSHGQVVAEYTCPEIRAFDPSCPAITFPGEDFYKSCWLTPEQLMDYAGDRKTLYAWRVEDPINYEKQQKPLTYIYEYGVMRPPQSWQFAWQTATVKGKERLSLKAERDAAVRDSGASHETL